MVRFGQGILIAVSGSRIAVGPHDGLHGASIFLHPSRAPTPTWPSTHAEGAIRRPSLRPGRVVTLLPAKGRQGRIIALKPRGQPKVITDRGCLKPPNAVWSITHPPT